MRLLFSAFCLLLSACCLPPAAAAQEVSLRISVRLVSILATVRGADGELAPALTTDDFEVRDEGVPQPIRVFGREADLPLSIALLLDLSGSTAKDLKFEQESAIRFLHSILRPQDRASLFTFTHEVVQVAPFTSSTARLEQAVRAARPQGGTSLFDAIYLASEELRKQPGRRVMVVISDGGDTTSGISFHQALHAAQDADAVIYSVVIVPIRSQSGRDIGGEHALQLLSEGTGGRALTPDSAGQLDPAFASIGQELRTHYLLGFYVGSGGALDAAAGAYRRLEVRVKTSGFTVQARKGYYLRADHR